MRDEVAVTEKATLREVQRRFEQWRKRRRRGEAISGELWAAAVRLTKEHSIVGVSKALGLNYTKLKERTGRAATKEEQQGPRLVEVDFCGSGFPLGQCVLEYEDSRGGRLTVSLHGKTDVDVEGIIRVLWGAGVK